MGYQKQIQRVRLLTLLWIIIFLACKDDEKGLPDIAKESSGYRIFSYQTPDSIDANMVAHFSKPWPDPSAAWTDFTLTSLNTEHTFYKKETTYQSLVNHQYYNHTDYVYMDGDKNILPVAIYNNYGDSSGPDSLGVFIGKYGAGSKTIYGYFRYRAIWLCSYCPTGARTRVADVVVQANFH